MGHQPLDHTDNWLDSRPPWSTSLPTSAPFRPRTSTQSLASSIENAKASRTTTPFGLLTQFLRAMSGLYLDDPGVIVDPNTGLKVGEGMTYVVEKRSVLSHRRGFSQEWVAVKRAKCGIPKAIGRGVAMPSASLTRLTAVLLETEILLHPPLQKHPNIAHLIGFSWDLHSPGYTPLLVMEFASFGTLVDLFNTHQLEDIERRELCLDVALGLEVLHSNMIVHGDIKQENILVFPHPQKKFIAKISDFGLSLLGSDQQVYRGTAIYNAPEIHLQDSAAISEAGQILFTIPPDQFVKCDIFSYGLLVFEILNGGQRYHCLPESKPFQDSLKAPAEVLLDGDILTSALVFLDAVSMCEELARICRLVFQSTLRSSPRDRLPVGWNPVKKLFGAIIPETQRLSTVSIQPLRGKLISQHSMMEIMDSSVSQKWAADDILAELRLATEMGLEKKERARASFHMFLVSSGRFMARGTIVDIEPLSWFMQAAVLGHESALTIGHRIFEACQQPVPDVFSSQKDGIKNLTQVLDASTPVGYYSNAVRHMWSKQINIAVAEQIKELSKRREALQGTTGSITGCKFQEVKSKAAADEGFLLHLAICTGTAEDVTYLLEIGSDVNKQTPEGLTALHLACIYASVEKVTILVRYGADVSINDIDDVSPLHWSIFFLENDVFAVVKMLVQAGANLNSCVAKRSRKYLDDLGLVLDATPLWWAIMCRNHPAISALLYHGADVFFERRPPDSGYPRSCCIDAALGTICADTLAILLESGTLLPQLTTDEKETCEFAIGSKCSNQFQRWCMHGAAYEQAFSEVLRVLRRFGINFTYRYPGLDPSYKGRIHHATPLTEAADRLNLPLARALILNGADVNFRPERDSRTAIESVVFCHDMEDIPTVIAMIELLLDSGAEEYPVPRQHEPEGPPSKYKIFENLLSGAINFGVPVPVIRFLLSRAPKETYYGFRGRTLLGIIIGECDEQISSTLGLMFLNSGTNPSAEDKHDPSTRNCCFTAAAHGVVNWNWDFTRLCLDWGSTLEYGTSKGHRQSLVHLAVRQGLQVEFTITETVDKASDRKKAAEFLWSLLSHSRVKNTGIIDMPDYKGVTPLMWAIFWAIPSCVEALVENGADIIGSWRGGSLQRLVEVCKTFAVPEGFDLSDDRLTQRARAVEFNSIFPSYSKATYLKRLDEISLLLRHHDSLTLWTVE